MVGETMEAVDVAEFIAAWIVAAWIEAGWVALGRGEAETAGMSITVIQINFVDKLVMISTLSQPGVSGPQGIPGDLKDA